MVGASVEEMLPVSAVSVSAVRRQVFSDTGISTSVLRVREARKVG
ncbi:MAG: hypothetical protein ACTSWP_12455 [Candidatus Freyarchaeota archaeon]